MGNPNTELLTWAVENITEWNDDYTHLRSDNLEHPFFCTGVWLVVRDIYWKSSDIEENLYDKIFSKKFSTKTLQVITKQEWQAAKASSNTLKTSQEAPKGHIHANLMAEYAIVAKTSPEPWKEFEWFDGNRGLWKPLTEQPRFYFDALYRRKPSPKTMAIGGIVVEACPLKKAPKYKEAFFYVHLEDKFVVQELYWSGFNCGFCSQLELGRSFATQQEAQAVADALNNIYKKAVDEAWNS